MKKMFLPQTRKKDWSFEFKLVKVKIVSSFFSLVETENRSLEVLHQGPEIDGQKSIDQFG